MLKVKILDVPFYNQFGLPKQKTVGSAGLDLMAAVDDHMLVFPGDVKMVPTGIAIHIEDPKKAIILLPRSGLGHQKGIVLGNLVGLVDSDYQGQLFVSIWNRNSEGEPFSINRGDRIAQMVVVPVIQEEFVIVDSFDVTKRAEGGFGHTGI